MLLSLLCLPPELLVRIISYCDYPSTVALSLTCRILHGRVPPSQHRRYDMKDLLEIERWPCYDGAADAEGQLKQAIFTRDYFACHLCLRIRATTKYSNAMMKEKRGKHRLSSSDTSNRGSTRFCIDCGIRIGRYIPGTVFSFGGYRSGGLADTIGGGYGLVCLKCHHFGRVEWGSTGKPLICVPCTYEQLAG